MNANQVLAFIVKHAPELTPARNHIDPDHTILFCDGGMIDTIYGDSWTLLDLSRKFSIENITTEEQLEKALSVYLKF